MNKTFGLIGGDRRQTELAQLLAADGHTVYTYGLECKALAAPLEKAISAKTLVLPLPLCKDDGMLNCQGDRITTQALFQRLSPSQRVLAGQVRPAQQQEAAAYGLALEDYFLREELTVANAAITAEGAIQTALEQLEYTLLGMRCLVMGFGRIGKLLCHRLHGLGAQVTATARQPADLAWIRAYGWPALESGQLNGKLDDFGAVFNTIPSLILDKTLLAQLPQNCLCVDLASRQGIDLEAAQARGLSAVWARGLPGKLAPQAAAIAIRDVIYQILQEDCNRSI